MKNLSVRMLVVSGVMLFTGYVMAQESDTTTIAEEKPAKDKRPVKDPFESGYLMNSHTIVVPTAKTLEMIIQHRFGKLNSEDFDLLGLYAPSNIRIGFNYSVTGKIQAGIGSTKNYKLQDINWKYAILRQTRSESIPVAVTYFGNVVIDVRKNTTLTFTNRLSFFHQLIFARKFSNKISFQVAPSFTHFNIVDSLVKHDNIAITASGRVKITDVMGINIEYNHQLTKQDTSVLANKPGLSIGLEAVTSAHVFQIFIGSMDAIIPQHDVLYNKNNFLKKDILIGFNITRLWNF